MIYDCFMYFDEDMLLDLRLNIMHEFVDYFVIIESKYTHQGEIKEKKLNLSDFKKFQDKIIYIYNEDKIGKNNAWEQENFQRNLINKGIIDAKPDDYILISDLDEIPNPKKLKKIFDHVYSVFNQSVFYYKFNLKNISEKNWYGTKCCKKKYLSSPQKLRNEKIKQYPFWRLDKVFKRKFHIIEDGGWHFTYIKTLSDIKNKIKSFAHKELNKEIYLNDAYLKKKIENGEDLFERDFKFEKVDINEKNLPSYLLKNLNKYSDWLL